jgi:hypothetical protein
VTRSGAAWRGVARRGVAWRGHTNLESHITSASTNLAIIPTCNRCSPSTLSENTRASACLPLSATNQKSRAFSPNALGAGRGGVGRGLGRPVSRGARLVWPLQALLPAYPPGAYSNSAHIIPPLPASLQLSLLVFVSIGPHKLFLVSCAAEPNC